MDRRRFSLGMLVALAACNQSEKSNAAMPNSGPLSGLTTFDTPQPVTWPAWCARFVNAHGRVIDTGNGGISHSEGQSYGLLLALQANDRARFELIAQWTEANLARNDLALYGWRWDPAEQAMTDPNNATDGDIVIAWALALAGARWNEPRYTERSRAVRAAIRQHCVLTQHSRQLLLPGLVGFVEGANITLNPSYFVWSALDHFAALDGVASWGGIIHDSEDLLRLSRFGPHHLPCDWIVVTGKNSVAPAPGKPPRFGFDAMRVALWAAQGRRMSLVAPIAAWWRSCLSEHRPIPAWIDVVTGEEANYALTDGGAAIAGRLIGTSAPVVLSEDYYAASQQMLARFTN
ncbi:MAG: glycosyl hydrolase family 8 [Novosphingobium sp.]|nr:glycosyl hydrolase family 8 [Novosphingobium sp.]